MVLLQHILLIHGPHKLQKIGTCILLSHTQNRLQLKANLNSLQLKANLNRLHRDLSNKDKPLNNSNKDQCLRDSSKIKDHTANSSQHTVSSSKGRDKVASNLSLKAITQILMQNKLRRPSTSNADATHMVSKSVMSTRKGI